MDRLSSISQQQANALERILREKGMHTEVVPARFGSGRKIYRLIVPDRADRDSAVAHGKELQRLFHEDEQIASLTR